YIASDIQGCRIASRPKLKGSVIGNCVGQVFKRVYHLIRAVDRHSVERYSTVSVVALNDASAAGCEVSVLEDRAAILLNTRASIRVNRSAGVVKRPASFRITFENQGSAVRRLQRAGVRHRAIADSDVQRRRLVRTHNVLVDEGVAAVRAYGS